MSPEDNLAMIRVPGRQKDKTKQNKTKQNRLYIAQGFVQGLISLLSQVQNLVI